MQNHQQDDHQQSSPLPSSSSNGLSPEDLKGDVVSHSITASFRRGISRLSINAASAELRDRLRGICTLAEKHIELGGEFKATSPAEELNSKKKEDAPKPRYIAERSLPNSLPGLREFVRDRFVSELNDSLRRLHPKMQTRILGRLVQSTVATENAGISVQLSEWDHGDPVFEAIGSRNEYSNFWADIANYSVEKLQEMNTPHAWAFIACAAAEKSSYLFNVVAAKAIQSNIDREEVRTGVKKALAWQERNLEKLTSANALRQEDRRTAIEQLKTFLSQ